MKKSKGKWYEGVVGGSYVLIAQCYLDGNRRMVCRGSTPRTCHASGGRTSKKNHQYPRNHRQAVGRFFEE